MPRPRMGTLADSTIIGASPTRIRVTMRMETLDGSTGGRMENGRSLVVHGLTLDETHQTITRALSEAVDFRTRIAQARASANDGA